MKTIAFIPVRGGSKSIPLKNIRQKVGLVFQYPEHQLFEMTVYKDVCYGPANLGLDEKEIANFKFVGETLIPHKT